MHAASGWRLYILQLHRVCDVWDGMSMQFGSGRQASRSEMSCQISKLKLAMRAFSAALESCYLRFSWHILCSESAQIYRKKAVAASQCRLSVAAPLRTRRRSGRAEACLQPDLSRRVRWCCESWPTLAPQSGIPTSVFATSASDEKVTTMRCGACRLGHAICTRPASGATFRLLAKHHRPS